MSSDPTPVFTIGQLAQVKGGKRMPTGTALTTDKTRHPYLRIVDFKDGSIDSTGLQYVPDAVFPQISRYVISSSDLYISIVGTVGLVGSVPRSLDGANLTENAAKICNIDTSKVDQRFLGYYLRSAAGQDAIRALTVGSTQPKLALFRIEQIEVPCPAMSVQRSIADLLGTLDARITFLRETNATLEAIAQALFKSWFVDFDPVHAKRDGRAPEGMDEATAALFPDSFEDSELGALPKGWQRCPVYEMATYINGAAYKAFEPNGDRRGRPIIKIAELKAGVTAQTAFSDIKMAEKYLIGTGDILFSWSGNPDTSIDTFVWAHEPAWLNQHIFRVIPTAPHERSFVLQLLRYLRPVFAELARNKQTTGLGHVTVADMKRLVVTKPTPVLLREFDQTTGALQRRVFANEQQALTLINLRDTLLPRLISGQLRMPEAAEIREEALA